jgi:hypothetical protein
VLDFAEFTRASPGGLVAADPTGPATSVDATPA